MRQLTWTDMERLEQLATLSDTGVTLTHEEFSWLVNRCKEFEELYNRLHLLLCTIHGEIDDVLGGE